MRGDRTPNGWPAGRPPGTSALSTASRYAVSASASPRAARASPRTRCSSGLSGSCARAASMAPSASRGRCCRSSSRASIQPSCAWPAEATSMALAVRLGRFRGKPPLFQPRAELRAVDRGPGSHRHPLRSAEAEREKLVDEISQQLRIPLHRTAGPRGAPPPCSVRPEARRRPPASSTGTGSREPARPRARRRPGRRPDGGRRSQGRAAPGPRRRGLDPHGAGSRTGPARGHPRSPAPRPPRGPGRPGAARPAMSGPARPGPGRSSRAPPWRRASVAHGAPGRAHREGPGPARPGPIGGR